MRVLEEKQYDIDQQEVKEYFPLETVRDGPGPPYPSPSLPAAAIPARPRAVVFVYACISCAARTVSHGAPRRMFTH